MKNKTLVFVIVLAAVGLGCPRRRTGLRLVYAPPAPTPATQQTPAESTQAMIIIEEPPPPAAAPKAPAQQLEISQPPAAPAPKRRHPKTAPAPPAQSVPTSQPADSPPLQPSIETAEAVGSRQRIEGLATSLRAEIRRLRRRTLPSADRKTLGDAELFLDQADQAVRTGDFQRSLRLEQKADLLVSAVRNR